MKAKSSMKIIGSGIYLPQVVTSKEIEQRYNLPPGYSEKCAGVRYRHHVTHESNSYMGAKAVQDALKDSGIFLQDVDLLIAAGATYDQPLPNMSSLIKAALDPNHETSFGAIDIDCTCLSFVSALHIASKMLDDSCKTIVIVSAEVSSKGLTSKRPETITLFGDAAAAFVITRDDQANSGLIKSSLITLTSGVDLTCIKGGGNIHPFSTTPYDEELHSFEMQGISLLRLAKRELPLFIDGFFDTLPIGINDVNVCIPHQASKMGLLLFQEQYHLSTQQLKTNLATHGNCIAASIPVLLHQTIKAGELNRGDTCLLLGTAAGFSIGATLFTY